MDKELNLSENEFIVGIDLGYDVATVSYLSHSLLSPVIYDISGGYGNPAIPLALLYIKEDEEWLIGEHALLNHQSDELIFERFLDLVKKNQSVQVQGKAYESDTLLRIFITKILEGFSHINPFAIIKGIVIALPDEFEKDMSRIKDNLYIHLTEDVIITTTTRALLYEIDRKGKGRSQERYILIGYEYNCFKMSELVKDETGLSLKKRTQDSSIGIERLEAEFNKELTHLYLSHFKQLAVNDEEKKQIAILSRQYFWLFFQKYAQNKPIKIYFNFAYPPFAKNITTKKMDQMIEVFSTKMNEIIKQYDQEENLEAVLYGQGYKMIWPEKTVRLNHQVFDINPIQGVSDGCVILGKRTLCNVVDISIKGEDYQEEKYYGIMTNVKGKETVLPIKASDNEKELLLIIDFEEEDRSYLKVFSLDHEEEIHKVGIIRENNERRARISLKYSLNIEKHLKLTITNLPL